VDHGPEHHKHVSGFRRKHLGRAIDVPRAQAVSNFAGVNDSGAGTIQDGWIDDPDESEEFVRRYSNVLDLRGTTLTYIVADWSTKTPPWPARTSPWPRPGWKLRLIFPGNR